MQDHKRLARLKPLLSVPVVPVLTIDRVEDALPLARALADGGLTTLEVTLRTSAALSSINVIAEALGNVAVGVGTVRTPEQAAAVIEAGAQFIVSPGITPRLAEAAQSWPVPFLPGAATASEMMALADMGYRVQKFFPAGASGGVAALKAFAAPLAGIELCPTGGVDASNASDYLALPNVICVGGSWVAPAGLVRRQDWAAITALAKDAAELAQ